MKRIILALCISSMSLMAEPARFAFIYTVNNGGYIDVCGCKNKKVKQGGIDRRSTLIKQIRAMGKPLLLLDGGSTFFEIKPLLPKAFEKKQLMAKAFVIVESMNRIGYQAMALGSADLRMGLDNLKKLTQSARFPMLCANFHDAQGKTVFKPWTIITTAGVRIGVIGLIMETLNPHFIKQVAPGCSVTSTVDAAKQAVAELKGKVDLIVALSHVNKKENEALGGQVPEISVLFDPNINYGSHSTFMSKPEMYVDRFGDTLVVRCDGEGMRLSRLDIEFEAPLKMVRTHDSLNRLEMGLHAEPLSNDLAKVLGRGDFNRGAITRISVEPHHIADPGIKALIDLWKKNDPGSIDPDSLKAMKTAPQQYALKDACAKCHKKQYEFWLTTAHAHAFKTLKDFGDHLRYDCIGCHTTGHGHTFLHPKNAGKNADVQCESCHGTHPAHVEDPEKAPNWPKIQEKDCLMCHNKHQLRIDFEYFKKKRLVTCPKMD